MLHIHYVYPVHRSHERTYLVDSPETACKCFHLMQHFYLYFPQPPEFCQLPSKHHIRLPFYKVSLMLCYQSSHHYQKKTPISLLRLQDRHFLQNSHHHFFYGSHECGNLFLSIHRIFWANHQKIHHRPKSIRNLYTSGLRLISRIASSAFQYYTLERLHLFQALYSPLHLLVYY